MIPFCFFIFTKLINTGCQESVTISTDVETSEYENCIALKTVSMISGQAIGSHGFSECFNLETLQLPTTLKSINNNAFYKCTSLKTVAVPEGVTKIEYSAFYGCSSLENVSLPSTLIDLQDSVFQFEMEKLTKVTFPNGNNVYKSNNDNGFYIYSVSGDIVMCGNSVREMIFPSDIEIKNTLDFAFYYCSLLTNVVFPACVEYLGMYTFGYCSNLESVTFSSNIKAIGGYTFFSCPNLRDIIFGSPSSLEDIPFGFVEEANSVVHINIPEGVKKINSKAFNHCSMETISFPSTLTTLGTQLFIKCFNLKTVLLSSLNQKYIIVDNYLFTNNGELVFFLNSVSESVVPAGITSILDYSFSDCISLKHIEIPDTVTSIGKYVFNECKILEKVEMKCKIQATSEGMFYSSGVKYVSLPSTISSIGLRSFCDCIELRRIHLPVSVGTIENSAFLQCSKLAKINFPYQLREIHPQAFSDCISLAYVTFPDSLLSIGNDAFMNCISLKTVIIPRKVTHIDFRAFSSCVKVEKVIFYDCVNTKYESNSFTGIPHFNQPLCFGSNTFTHIFNIYDQRKKIKLQCGVFSYVIFLLLT